MNTTLSRNRVADSLAHKVISKLGGAARWILAEGTLDTYAGRSMIASLPEHALIGGVVVVTPDAYASLSDRSTVTVTLDGGARRALTAAIDNNGDAAALKLCSRRRCARPWPASRTRRRPSCCTAPARASRRAR